MPDEERLAEMMRLISEEAVAAIRLDARAAAPPKLAAPAREEHMALLTMHHIVSDAWSTAA